MDCSRDFYDDVLISILENTHVYHLKRKVERSIVDFITRFFLFGQLHRLPVAGQIDRFQR